jgi:probable F420-dependent oxidoreductase
VTEAGSVHSGRNVARQLGRVGVWTFELDRMRVAEARTFVAEVEAAGYPALWVPESVLSREIFAHLSLLLGASSRLLIGSGIANIHARDPVAMANGARTLAEQYPGRLVLGLGVSHAPAVKRRGGEYDRPLTRMREYLDAMDRAPVAAPEPDEPAPRVLAALGPRMLELAAERTAGAHPYFVPVEHTRVARELVGESPLIATEQAVVLERDPVEARRIAREHMSRYLRLENYANNLRRLGFSDEDLADDGSDRLVDAIVAWGDEDDVLVRVRSHLDAGADHVCIQALPGGRLSVLGQLQALAPALAEV